jgi:hypothetical protein
MRREEDAKERFYFRTHRINCINGQWYFLVREGKNIGPFTTKEEAEKQLACYLKNITDKKL